MDLHRVRGQQADWHGVGRTDMNFFQRIASDTHGILTPANIVTVASAAVFVLGLIDILAGRRTQGVALAAVGALGDIFDGYLAQVTGTKSPLGEKLDAVIDKPLRLATLVVFVRTAILPLPIAILIAVHNAANTVAAAIGAARGKALHTSRNGKLSVFFQGISLGLYAIGALLTDHNHDTAATILIWGGGGLAVAATFGPGLVATRDYFKKVLDNS